MEEGDKQVSTNVLELARKLNIDPELVQEVYFASNLSEAVDGLDKNYLGSELEKFRSLKRVLAKQQTKFEHQDVIQITFRKTGFDLKKELINLQKRVDEMIKFSEERLRNETSGTRANKKAHEIAKYVANLFDSVGRNVGFGVQPLDADEPSTPFGRAVRDALSIFKVYSTPSSDFESLRIPLRVHISLTGEPSTQTDYLHSQSLIVPKMVWLTGVHLTHCRTSMMASL